MTRPTPDPQPNRGASQPLISKRILVTRPRAQAPALCDKLAALGAVPIPFSTIEIAPLEDYTALDRAIAALDQYHWIIFTSVNGVAAFWSRLDPSGFQNPKGLPCRVAAIGPATAQALEERGIRAEFIPEEYVAERILDGLGDVKGKRVLLARADIAREALAVELTNRGAFVHETPAYRTLPAAPDPRGLAELRRGVDAITFTSSSAVRNFVQLTCGCPSYVDAANLRRAGKGGVSMPSLDRTAIACIGPITAQTAREAGLPVDVMAKEYTMDGLVAALADYFSRPELQLKENRMQSAFPSARPRRLRLKPALRAMVRETQLAPGDFIYPLFVTHGRGVTNEIRSMPGVFQWSPDLLAREAESTARLGIPAVLLFGIPAEKDSIGLENFAPDGIVQQAIRVIKDAVPEMIVVSDVCLCEYTDHGHCGVLNVPAFADVAATLRSAPVGSGRPNPHLPEGYVLNDETLDVLAKVAVSHAEAGADVVAPSGMMDGMVAAIRAGLDSAGFEHLPILSYSTKYASGFYGPFREAAQGAPKFGDRKTHQMDPANAREALRETALDVAEGADMLMVKPALPYLDIIRAVRENFPALPLAAYNVSGEYAMIKAAAANGWLDEERATLELLTGIKRAGADLIITYHARDAAKWLK